MAEAVGSSVAEMENYLLDGEEVTIVASRQARCDGGGRLGHPVEYLTLEKGETVCKYCDRRFVHVSHPSVPLIRKSGERFTPA